MPYGSMHCSHSNIPVNNDSCKDNSEAVKALKEAVEQLKTYCIALNDEVADLKTIVGDSSGGLVKRVSDLENA